MECEVCGRQIYGKSHKIIIDGANLLVCFDCSQFTPIQPKMENRVIKSTKSTFSVRTRGSRPRINLQAGSSPQPIISEDSVLVEDYGKRIRRGRERLNLTHEELSRKIGAKISLLQKLETGKMVPDLNLTTKLESTLRIKLLSQSARIKVDDDIFTQKPINLTLGDIVVQKKRRGGTEE